MCADLPSAPVVELPRAVADAALAMTRPDSVRALVASAIRTGRCTPSDLMGQLTDGPRGGSRLLRIAVEEMGGGARSAAEARALAELRRARVPSFEFNVPVVDRAGRVRWVLDVLWRELRAVLEIDSAEYHFGPRAWEATMARHNALQRFGLAVTHHPPSRIMRAPAAWRVEVEQWLRARSDELRVPYRLGGLRPAEPYLL